MSTITQIIAMIDSTICPGNRFDQEMKTRWIYEVDAKAFDELIRNSLRPGKPASGFWYQDDDGWHQVINGTEEKAKEKGAYITIGDPLQLGDLPSREICVPELQPYCYAKDADKRLLLPDRFNDTYVHYCSAKMAAADNEIDEYNNQAMLYEASWQEYASWYIRHHSQPGPDRYED